ncbi:hypothetical protein BFP97_06135 [Roseivirga sp. 4D4]|nr:hypothetical protein BFP97_06135 [Roseivirga sp. 4D4]
MLLAFSISLVSCDNTEEPQKELSYLALGDSYTIGESVNEADRWPEQLVDTLITSGITIERPRIIAKTGWRTDQLKDSLQIDPGRFRKYDLVSLLIGVNNQVQGRTLDRFETELIELIQMAINLADGDMTRVFVLSIPNYGKTQFGIYLGGEAISQEIAQFNAVIREVCDNLNIRYFNITPISEEVINDTSLLGSDNFHPSGKMYKLWVDLMFEDIYQSLLR